MIGSIFWARITKLLKVNSWLKALILKFLRLKVVLKQIILKVGVEYCKNQISIVFYGIKASKSYAILICSVQSSFILEFINKKFAKKSENRNWKKLPDGRDWLDQHWRHTCKNPHGEGRRKLLLAQEGREQSSDLELETFLWSETSNLYYYVMLLLCYYITVLFGLIVL